MFWAWAVNRDPTVVMDFLKKKKKKKEEKKIMEVL